MISAYLDDPLSLRYSQRLPESLPDSDLLPEDFEILRAMVAWKRLAEDLRREFGAGLLARLFRYSGYLEARELTQSAFAHLVDLADQSDIAAAAFLRASRALPGNVYIEILHPYLCRAALRVTGKPDYRLTTIESARR